MHKYTFILTYSELVALSLSQNYIRKSDFLIVNHQFKIE